MHAVNKNKILEYHYNECSDKEREIIVEHLNSCNICSQYLDTIRESEKKLDMIPDKLPAANILSNILEEIEESANIVVKTKQTFSVVPILQIASGLIFILTLIYIIQAKINLLPLWHQIESIWFIQSFGTIGVAVLLVMCIGTFLTLSIAPILLIESQKNKNFS